MSNLLGNDPVRQLEEITIMVLKVLVFLPSGVIAQATTAIF